MNGINAPFTSDASQRTLDAEMRELGSRARAAAERVRAASAAARSDALTAMARRLRAAAETILAANTDDVREAQERGLAASFIDRLKLDGKSLAAIAAGIETIAALPDPLGAVLAAWTPPNGLRIERVRTPIGV